MSGNGGMSGTGRMWQRRMRSLELGQGVVVHWMQASGTQLAPGVVAWDSATWLMCWHVWLLPSADERAELMERCTGLAWMRAQQHPGQVGDGWSTLHPCSQLHSQPALTLRCVDACRWMPLPL